eukprot:COSAG02_NODE_1989_length_10174_cov_12.502134_2_plen_69_part_00
MSVLCFLCVVTISIASSVRAGDPPAPAVFQVEIQTNIGQTKDDGMERRASPSPAANSPLPAVRAVAAG